MQYWEAFTAVHQMHSKWLDVGMHLAAFHLQSARYNSIKPPSFGQHPHLTSIERERERINEPTREEIEQQIDERIEKDKEMEKKLASKFSRWGFRKRRPKKNSLQKAAVASIRLTTKTITSNNPAPTIRRQSLDQRIKQTRKSINGLQPPRKHLPPPKKAPSPVKMGGKTHRRVVSSVSCVSQADVNQPLKTNTDSLDERPLFLQEAAHLLSLLSAVSLSTLRNDLEHAEYSLIPFEPGMCYNIVMM